MTISRVNGADFGIGDMFTSAQATQLDKNTTYAADKRSGQTDTIQAVWTMSGTGRIVPSVTTGADANTTYTVGASNNVLRVTSAVTASRTYTLSATNAVTNDEITIYCESSFSSSFEIIVKDQSANTLFVIGNGDSADGQWAQFIYIGGWRLFRGGQGSRSRSVAFTTTGVNNVWTCPRGVTLVGLLMVGAGGGGGKGSDASVPTSLNVASGGGGGGGAILNYFTAPTVPGEDYHIFVPTGGTAGTSGNGGHGGDTTFKRVSTSTYLATAMGAMGGVAGDVGYRYCNFNGDNQTPYHRYAAGGASVKTSVSMSGYTGESSVLTTLHRNNAPQTGGYGITNMFASAVIAQRLSRGVNSPQNYSGGSGGSYGTDASTLLPGGGAGGGGGAGPYCDGGAGGSGTNGTSGTSTSATAGSSPTDANSGAGGGGGGAPGTGNTGSGSAGAGAAGSSGHCIILYVK